MTFGSWVLHLSFLPFFFLFPTKKPKGKSCLSLISVRCGGVPRSSIAIAPIPRTRTDSRALVPRQVRPERHGPQHDARARHDLRLGRLPRILHLVSASHARTQYIHSFFCRPPLFNDCCADPSFGERFCFALPRTHAIHSFFCLPSLIFNDCCLLLVFGDGLVFKLSFSHLQALASEPLPCVCGCRRRRRFLDCWRRSGARNRCGYRGAPEPQVTPDRARPPHDVASFFTVAIFFF